MNSVTKTRWLGAVLALSSVGCAAAPRQQPGGSVALFVSGREPLRGDAERAVLGSSYGVTVRVAALPNAPSIPAAPKGEVELTLASARKHYLTGGFEGAQQCAAELRDAHLIWESLASGMRATALRILLWKTVCDAIFQEDAAVADASNFASLEAELPSEASSIPVRASELLGQALASAEKEGRRSVTIAAQRALSPVVDASVFVDGQPSACKTPCAIDLRPGDHWIRVERDGFGPSARVVRVERSPTTARIVFDLEVASPEEASRQWTRRFGGSGEPSDSAASLELLSLAVRTQQLVFLKSEALGPGVRLRGALTRNGAIAAREERDGTDLRGGPDVARDVVRDLLVKGKLVEDPSLLKKPLFWVIVASVTTAAAVGITALALRGEQHSLTTQLRGTP